jgi:tRNA-specific 2-thiouridylase
MEVCFLGGEHHAAFIRERRGYPGSPGQLVDRQNRVLGRHRGLEHYTVGQRRGLGVPAKEPYYVVALAPAANRVILGTREELLAPGLTATEVNWLIPPPAGPMEAIAVIRYRHPGAAARLTPQEGDTVQVEFAQPQRAVAPGQAVAFYRGDRVIAGGWIASPMT